MANPCLAYGDRRVALEASVLVLCALGMAPPALAAPRTFVASYGADANPCTLASPCRSFAAAIARTTAHGEIVVVDSAGYGSVAVTKSVSIVAPRGIHAGISVFSGVHGIDVDGDGIDVALRGLTLNGLGGSSGIHVVRAARVDIDRCDVAQFTADGLYVNASGAQVHVAGSTFRRNGYAGVRVVDGDVTIERSHVDDNDRAGVVAIHNARAAIDRSSLSGNTSYGVEVNAFGGAAAHVTLTGSLIADNGAYGVAALATGGTASIVARGNTVADNGTSCDTCAGIVADATAGQSASVVASANAVTGSAGYGLKQANAGTLRSSRDNAVVANGAAATSGTITPVAGE